MDYINEDGVFTDDFKSALPELLGDDYYNDKEKTQPTKEFDNIKDLPSLLKKTLNGSRKISAHGEELKKATEGMIKIPGEGATEDEVKAYRTALGVPETPEGYQLNVPEEGGFKEIAELVKASALEAGIPPSKLTKVWEPVVNTLVAQSAELDKKGMELLETDKQALKDLMKDKYDSFIQDTDKVASHFNIAEDAVSGTKADPIGDEFMKLMDSMGIKDTPTVRRFLGAIAPLVLEGKTAGGGKPPVVGGEVGFTNYEYDENGRPI